MENNTVPYIAHESAMARLERIIKRLWIVIIILIALLFATNAAWIYYQSQWEVISTQESYEADAKDGGNAVINGSGQVSINGEGKVHEENNQP